MAMATTVIVAMPNEAKVASPVRNMPDMATSTVSPEISRPARRRRCGLERRLFASTLGTLLPLTLQMNIE